jgi:hypothetical protein
MLRWLEQIMQINVEGLLKAWHLEDKEWYI